MPKFILYTKAGCHLCEGLQEKLAQIDEFNFELEIRDISLQAEWFEAFQYEVPVLKFVDSSINRDLIVPRPSPRLSVVQLTRHLSHFLSQIGA